MRTFYIAFEAEAPYGSGIKSFPYFDTVEEFSAEDYDAAEKYAAVNYRGREWYVLDENGNNINS